MRDYNLLKQSWSDVCKFLIESFHFHVENNNKSEILVCRQNRSFCFPVCDTKTLGQAAISVRIFCVFHEIDFFFEMQNLEARHVRLRWRV